MSKDNDRELYRLIRHYHDDDFNGWSILAILGIPIIIGIVIGLILLIVF